MPDKQLYYNNWFILLSVRYMGPAVSDTQILLTISDQVMFMVE